MSLPAPVPAPGRALPDVVARLRPHVASLPDPARPALMAVLERGAGARYRAWADEAGDPVLAIALRLCAAREESIAAIAEALWGAQAAPHRDAIGAALARIRSDVGDAYAGRPLAERFAIQARAERGGAAAWRERIPAAAAPERTALELCARLEEQSAEFLESLATR